MTFADPQLYEYLTGRSHQSKRAIDKSKNNNKVIVKVREQTSYCKIKRPVKSVLK